MDISGDVSMSTAKCMECYCVSKGKKNLWEKTKLQTAIVIICLWIWDLLACPVLYCDWSLHNHHSWTISDVHGFLSLMVNRPFAWWCVFTTKTRVHFVFSFLFNFVIQVRFKINIKDPHLHKKEKPWRIMVVEVKRPIIFSTQHQFIFISLLVP